jgi:hypothetical protein
MSVIVTERTFEVRFYREESPTAFADYHAICTIIRLDADKAMIVGFNGDISRSDMRALITVLHSKGYKFLLAQRAPGRRVPLGTQLPDDHTLANWWQLNIEEAMIRASKTKSKHQTVHNDVTQGLIAVCPSPNLLPS